MTSALLPFNSVLFSGAALLMKTILKMTMMHSPAESTLLTSFVVFLLFILPIQAINRTVGPPHDQRFIDASNHCNGHDPASFTFGPCSLLIDCVYEHLDESLKASLSCGTSIAALLPTILVLISERIKLFEVLVTITPFLPSFNNSKYHIAFM